MKRTYATNLFDEARRASWPLVIGLLAVHELFLFLVNLSLRAFLDDLKRAKVRSAGGSMVPLAELVRVHERSAADVLERRNLYPMIEFTANLFPGASLAEARAFCEKQGAETLAQDLRMTWLHKRN
jgi:multidrug efflux pump subunit AcrB